MHVTTLKKTWILLATLAAAVSLAGCHRDSRAAAPTSLSYASPQTFTVGTAIAPLSPGVTGTVTAYAVAPALPAGLAIDGTSGVISGTPSVIASQATYTITAQNTVGSTTFALAIAVNPAPPSALSYASPQSFVLGTPIVPLLPTVSGVVSSFSVSPALPAGLSLNATSGQISGTPTTASAQATYTVTAQNAGGSRTFALLIAVTAVPPSALSYATPQSFTVGSTITPLLPTVTGVVSSYSVLPALPNGLALNAASGQITGTPLAATAQTTYTVTASNSGGSTSFGLVIGVGSVAVLGWQPTISLSSPNALSVSSSDVAASTDGNTAVSWIERDANGSYGVRVRRFDITAGQWLASELAGSVPAGTASVFGQRVAVATGNRIAVGEILNVSNLVKEGVVRYDAGADNSAAAAWSATDVLSPGSSRADGVRNNVAAFSNDGSVAMTVWSQFDTTANKQWLFARAYRYAACRYPAAAPPCAVNPADVGLRPAANIEATPSGANAMALAAVGTSDIIAAWYSPNAAIAGRTSIYYSRYDGRLGVEAWSTPAVVNVPGATNAILPNYARPLAANAAGDAALVWSESGAIGSGISIYLSRIRGSGGGWSAPELIDVPFSFAGGPIVSQAGNAGNVDVTIDPAGVVTVAWIQLPAANPTDAMLHVRRCAPGQACGAPVIYPLGAGRTSTSPILVASPNGDVTVVWQVNFPEQTMGVRYTASNGSWDATPIMLSGSFVLIPFIAADGFNRVTVVWEDPNGGGVQAKRFQ